MAVLERRCIRVIVESVASSSVEWTVTDERNGSACPPCRENAMRNDASRACRGGGHDDRTRLIKSHSS